MMYYAGFDTFEEWQAWWDKELSKPPKPYDLHLPIGTYEELQQMIKGCVDNDNNPTSPS